MQRSDAVGSLSAEQKTNVLEILMDGSRGRVVRMHVSLCASEAPS